MAYHGAGFRGGYPSRRCPRLRHRDVALAAVVERRELEVDRFAVLLTRAELHLAKAEARHGSNGSVPGMGQDWFVAGFVGGFAVLLLALIAPRAGRPWRSRAFLALGLFAVIALAVVLLVVAISEANLVTP
jgi:hypothetical protein